MKQVRYKIGCTAPSFGGAGHPTALPPCFATSKSLKLPLPVSGEVVSPLSTTRDGDGAGYGNHTWCSDLAGRC